MVIDALKFAIQQADPKDLLTGPSIDIDLLSGLEPLIETIRPLILKLSVVVGGIFGLYLILILVRVYYERKKVNLLKAIKYDLDVLNEHNKIPSSRQKKGIVKKLVGKLHNNSEKKKKKSRSKK